MTDFFCGKDAPEKEVRTLVFAKHRNEIDFKAWSKATPGEDALSCFLSGAGSVKTVWSMKLNVVWFTLEAECGFVGGLRCRGVSHPKAGINPNLYIMSMGEIKDWQNPPFQSNIVSIVDAYTKRPLLDPEAFVTPGSCLIFTTKTYTCPVENRSSFSWVHVPEAARKMIASAIALPELGWNVLDAKKENNAFCYQNALCLQANKWWLFYHPRIQGPIVKLLLRKAWRLLCKNALLPTHSHFKEVIVPLLPIKYRSHKR